MADFESAASRQLRHTPMYGLRGGVRIHDPSIKSAVLLPTELREVAPPDNGGRVPGWFRVIVATNHQTSTLAETVRFERTVGNFPTAI